jgi:hypothetical protein
LSALALPVVAAGAGTSPALAQTKSPPVRVYLGEEYGLGVTGDPGPFCVGESVQFTVRVVRYGVYQDEDQQVNVPRSAPYRLLRTGIPGSAGVSFDSSNPSVLGSLVLSFPYTNGAAHEEVFTTHAAKVGTTTVRFRVESPGVDPAQASVQVEVTDCDYEVHTFSIWHITGGRNDVGASSIDTVIRRQGAGLLLITLVSPNAMSENLVIQFPRGECPFSRTISTSAAPVTGYLDLTNSTLDVKIEYSAVTAASEETCQTPVGPITGSTDANPGTPAIISFELDPGGGADSDDHILHIPGLGDFTGMTFITVTPIHL